MPRRWDLAGLARRQGDLHRWAIVVPLLVYPWWVVAAGYVGFTMATSLVTATTFQLAHCVEEAGFASAEELDGEQADLGGARGRDDRRFLPAQRVSHLGARRAQLPDRAPSLPARPAHALSADRRDRQAQRGEARRALHGAAVALAALRSHQRHLRALGRMGVPAEIEMG